MKQLFLAVAIVFFVATSATAQTKCVAPVRNNVDMFSSSGWVGTADTGAVLRVVEINGNRIGGEFVKTPGRYYELRKADVKKVRCPSKILRRVR